MTNEPKTENFRDLMNKTDAEMQRLGWTIDQGREHLSRFYRVRWLRPPQASRLQLTEEELDNFLLYLQLTDSPNPKSQP